MTYHDRKEILRDFARYYNWRLMAGFLASTVITVSSIVWTAATLYYNNKAEIEDIRVQNANHDQMQDYRIGANEQSIKDCCPIKFRQ